MRERKRERGEKEREGKGRKKGEGKNKRGRGRYYYSQKKQSSYPIEDSTSNITEHNRIPLILSNLVSSLKKTLFLESP